MTPLRVLESARTVVRNVGRAAAVHAYEVGALASTVAMAGLCVVGGGFEPASSAVAAYQSARRSHGSSCAARPRVRGYEVKLVRDRKGPTRPRHHGRHDHIQPIGKFCGATCRRARRRGGDDPVSNRCGQGASGRTQSGRCRHRSGHRRRRPGRAGRHRHYLGLPVRGIALGGPAAVRGSAPGADQVRLCCAV